MQPTQSAGIVCAKKSECALSRCANKLGPFACANSAVLLQTEFQLCEWERRKRVRAISVLNLFAQQHVGWSSRRENLHRLLCFRFTVQAKQGLSKMYRHVASRLFLLGWYFEAISYLLVLFWEPEKNAQKIFSKIILLYWSMIKFSGP